MKHVIACVFAASFFLSFQAYADGAATPGSGEDCTNAQTQTEMDLCAQKDYKTADDKLNAVYKQVLAKFAKDKKFIERFKEAQRAWLLFRDAEVKAIYPHDDGDPRVEYGSVYPMCVSELYTQLTEERTKQLEAWLTGTEEGEVCGGSMDGPVTPEG